MKLTEFVCPEAVIPQLSTNDRDSVIKELVAALSKADKLNGSDPESLIKALIDRENEASTGIGKGVAVPHVKYSGVTNVIAAVGLSSTGIDFASLDKQPVYSVILLISPAGNPDMHLQAMEIIFKNLQNDDFRSFLRQSETSKAVMDLLSEADDDCF